jgi:uncharacterized damage-inducible protein DinB
MTDLNAPTSAVRRSLERLTQLNLALLHQGRTLIHEMSDDAFTAPIPPLSQHGVGCHFRHCLDYYRCFLEGAEAGRINYDHRQRDQRLESDRGHALQTIDRTVERLEAITGGGDRPVLVSGDSAGAPRDAGDEGLIWSQSTLQRELLALVSHTVHHYALISMLLRTQGVDPGDAFGVAPSTLEHWKAQTVCAS